MKWLMRVLWGLLISFLAVVFLLLIFISPVVEWVIEKYSYEYIGRQVQMEDLTINLLVGRLHIENMTINESKGSEQVWLTCNNISGAINVPSLLLGKYELQYVIVDGLNTSVVQNGNKFNFDDLLRLPEKFASKKEKQEQEESSKVDWTIENVFLTNSQLRYASEDYDIDYTASSIDIFSPLISSNAPRMNFRYAFDIHTGGHLKGAYSICTDDMNYGLHFVSDKLNLSPTYPYVREFIAINELNAMLDSDLYLFGNHRNSAYLYTDGDLGLYDVNVIDSIGQSIATIGRFDLRMDSVETNSKYYDFGDITLTGPFIKFERYKEGDNWTRLMKSAASEEGVPVENSSYSNPFVIIADYLREYIKDYIVSDYYADHISLRNGAVDFNDFTLHDKFTAQLDSMTMDIDRLNTDNDRLRMQFATSLNKTGNFDLNVAINPRDYQDMEMEFGLKDFNMSIINPYMIYYVASPFAEGVMDYENKTIIASGIITADNKININKPKIGKKVKNSTAMNNLPVKLAVGMLKNPQGNIELDIPVEGDLKDPNYKLGKAIWNIIKNLIIKAAQAPVNGFVSLVGDKEENLTNITIPYGLDVLMPDQLRSLRKMAEPLRINDALEIEYTQWIDAQEEVNTLITLEARRKHAEEEGLLSKSEKKDKIKEYKTLLGIGVNDSLFVQWLKNKTGKKGVVESPIEKCKRIVDVSAMSALQQQYAKRREALLIETLVEKGVERERMVLKEKG